MVSRRQEKQSTTTFTPGVVEPSFGIDRILFSVLEHTYYARPKDPSPWVESGSRMGSGDCFVELLYGLEAL